MNEIKAGDEIKIRPEFQDAGDDQFRWFAVDNAEKGRVAISPEGVLNGIQPVQVVETRMVERVA